MLRYSKDQLGESQITPGGAEYNVACSLAKLGVSVKWISALPHDKSAEAITTPAIESGAQISIINSNHPVGEYRIIRGKNKTTFTPHMNHGDFIIVKNIEKIKFTGSKFKNKKYYKHTGHPGGIKETTPEKLSIKKPEEILKLAVKRMLPKGPLANKQMSRLKIYKGDKHPHEIQKPKEISLSKMNKKNIFSKS